MMNDSCYITADSTITLSFFTIGLFLSIVGCILNICSCLLFIRTKSLFNTPYGVFIIGLSIVDIIKIIAEYFVHLLFLYIEHPYFVCSITWFLTMTSENISYGFLSALGIERNLKVWTIDRRWLITRKRALVITIFITISIIIYNHPFLFWPHDASYCYFVLFNHPTIYTCNNAHYNAYGYSYSLTKLLLIENIGLNNVILPIVIISTNIILVIGLRRRIYQRRQYLGKIKNGDWRERSIIIYMLLSSLAFVVLTLPVGMLVAWGIAFDQQIPTNNSVLIFDLMEIIHHCSHFPILLMTSSKIRRKCFYDRKQRLSLSVGSRSFRLHSQKQSTNQNDRCQTVLCCIWS